jgi:hypothetical protein
MQIRNQLKKPVQQTYKLIAKAKLHPFYLFLNFTFLCKCISMLHLDKKCCKRDFFNINVVLNENFGVSV